MAYYCATDESYDSEGVEDTLEFVEVKRDVEERQEDYTNGWFSYWTCVPCYTRQLPSQVNDTEITVADYTQNLDSQSPRCPLFLVPSGVHEVSQCHRLSFPRTSIQRRNTDLEQVDDIRLTWACDG